MADNTLASWAPFLYDLKGKMVEVFPTEAPFLAELSGVGDAQSVGRFTRDMDGNREIFSGKSVKHSLILAMLPGGGFVTESGTWNVPHTMADTEVHINLVRCVQPFSVTVDVERDSFDNSSAVAVATMVREARIALARIENFAFLGDGTGLVANVTSATGSPGLVVPINVTTVSLNPWDTLLPGTVWDIVTRSTGADAGQGLRRKIASVQESAGTVTFDTAQQASDGGVGNITFAATSGIYLPGSWSNAASGASAPGNLTAQGLQQIAAASGTFQTVDKAVISQWQGTDGRGGDATVLPLSDQLLGAAVRRGRRAGLGVWDYGIGDPAVIDLYKDGKIAQVRYDPQYGTIKSGFPGIIYDGADKPFPLVKEPIHLKGALHLVENASLQLYGDQKGPSFLEDDGSMFRRFTRSLPKEADMLDRVQLGAIKCNTIVKIYNLAQS
jgi:hypothetical protein